MKISRPKKLIDTERLLSMPYADMVYTVVESCEIVDAEPAEMPKLQSTDLHDLTTKIALLEERLNQMATIKSETIVIPPPPATPIKLDRRPHFQFEALLKMVSAGLNVFLVGPAGSGKTTAAIDIAKALNVDFHFTGAIASEFKLTGFINAGGNIVSTEFRKAYEDGGLFLFDEIDASFPQALLAFNAALSNEYMDFPDKRIKKHEKFYCIAAANTYGMGADRQFVGRNQLDAASLDRFAFLSWKYDEEMEKTFAVNQEWVSYVQKIRKAVEQADVLHVVSPRATIFGGKLLEMNVDRETVEKTCIWKGLDEDSIMSVKAIL